MSELHTTLEQVRSGGKRAMAAALARIDTPTHDEAACRLLDEAFLAPRAQVLGLTGPPGVGKSTLINCLIKIWRGRGLTVGVIAVDPSSPRSRGALLGDRVRMRTDPDDEGIFIRSLAARGRLGGLSDITFATAVLMRAVYDRVIVESIGVGQSETDIASVADTVVLCVQPGSGDSLQFMKAGIMEIPHIAVVTKADIGPQASRALAELKGALSIAVPADPEWNVPCILLSAAREQNVAELILQAERHFRWLDEKGQIGPCRQTHAEAWLKSSLANSFGQQGIDLLGEKLRLPAGAGPFIMARNLESRLRISLA